MNTPPSQSRQEARAAQRFTLLNLVRIASVFAVGGGIAMAREAIPGPYVLGVALSLIGVAGFFFAPPLLARRWKAQDTLDR